MGMLAGMDVATFGPISQVMMSAARSREGWINLEGRNVSRLLFLWVWGV